MIFQRLLEQARNMKSLLPMHAGYKAFISYSHSADSALAPALQTALERFAKPWYQKRTFRVFRDTTNLSIAPELWPEIEKALAESDYLLLMASRGAAKSKWVTKEVTYWREKKGSFETADRSDRWRNRLGRRLRRFRLEQNDSAAGAFAGSF
jgi:MTH538 TIR-like domain (DUF1863)